MSIGSRIKQARTNLGYTQEQLAKFIGVTKGAIANYENSVSVPKVDLLYKLFEVLKCDANFLYQDDMKIDESVILNNTEKQLIHDFRDLSKQGQELLLQNMIAIKGTFKKSSSISDMENLS